MDLASYPRIVPFADASSTNEFDWTDDRHASEMPMKGWVHIHVETTKDVYYEVCFYDPVRLRQEMEYNIGVGVPCYAEYGALVLLPEVTIEAVEKSVQYLWEQGYFAYWKPDEKFKETSSG